MRIGKFLCTALLAVLVPVSSPQECGMSRINHDEVKAFSQVDPKTEAEKAAVKFNPTVVVTRGCYPYAMVNEVGQTSKGLKPSGSHNGHCKGSGHGSQVYARSTKHKGKLAIAYAYYTPKAQPHQGLWVRHAWNVAVVWINNSEGLEKVVAVTTRNPFIGFVKKTTFEPYEMAGESVKLHLGDSNLYLRVTGMDGGTALPLITWEQLPEKAHCALNLITWDGHKMPLSDGVFETLITGAWPFDEKE